MSMERFMRVYPNVGPAEKKSTVVVIDGEPYSWTACYQILKAGGSLGRRVQSELEKIGAI